MQTMPELTLEKAKQLFDAGRLHELIGIAPNASQAEVKTGRKHAFLRHHPDRGGDAEIFKLVYAASEQLKSDDHCFVFTGPVPAWAEWELARIAAQQDIIRKGENEVASLTRKLERPCSERIKADVRAEMDRIQGAIARSRVRLRELRAKFVRLRDEHDKKEAVQAIAALDNAHKIVTGSALEKLPVTATTDARFFGLYADTPALVYGPTAQAIHGFNERVELESVRRITQSIALFIAGWCGLEEISK